MRFPWTKKASFDTDLLRLIAVELHYRNIQSTAVEMFGKKAHELQKSELEQLGRWMLPFLRDVFNILTPVTLSRESHHRSDDDLSFFKTR
jgi:hypothetical protein